MTARADLTPDPVLLIAAVHRHGPAEWHTPARRDRAARLLADLLEVGRRHGVELSDWRAVTDLPGAAYDAVMR